MAPCVQDRGRVAPQLVPSISQHESVAKRRLDVDGPEIHQFCRFNAAAPWRADDSREGYAFRPDLYAHSDCVRAPSLAEIPLSGAVIELEACWIAGSAWSISMAHQRDVPAFTQGLPSDRRVRGRGRYGNYERNDSYDLEHTHRRLDVASPGRGTRNVGYHGGTRYGVPLIGGPFPESDRKMLLGADYAVNLSPTI